MPHENGVLQNESSPSQMTRAASYNHIPTLDNQQPRRTDYKRTFSEVNLSQSTESQKRPSGDGFTTGKEILRQSSLRSSTDKSRKEPRNFSLPSDASPERRTAQPKVKEPPKDTEQTQQSRSVSGTIASLTRKKWHTPRTRSPSPTPNKPKSTQAGNNNGTPVQETGWTGIEAKSHEEKPAKRTRKALGNFSGKSKEDTSSSTLKKSSSIQSLRKRASVDRLNAPNGAPDKSAPPVPQAPKKLLSSRNHEGPRKKDELWSVFRALDADYQKFQAKSIALKANVVRTSFIPCLTRYYGHPSINSLRPEDLDRRINILNKWWTGLLEILNGSNSQSITGSDRPVYLEAIIAIMVMPEWRVPKFTTQPSAASVTRQRPGMTSRKNSSVDSTGSDFLVESIHHNIRNIFSQNLLSQLSYCIDKMSVRHTPASIVAFCGKTCAHAFFFCPHVADVLVRLWNLSPDLVRGVANSFEPDPNPRIRSAISENIAGNFPASVRSLSFTSHTTLARYLRVKTLGPLATARINWFGPWTSRWTGDDTDLFFVFLKHFHILVGEFLPHDTDRLNLLYVPGLVPVHAQMLTVLENTLNKQSAPQSLDSLSGPTSATFDDFMDGADAAATALPLGAANKFRTMSENRLVMMLRDFLRDPTPDDATKRMLAVAFCGILKLAARRTSLFNHNACFTLCDFVEELVSIVPPYCTSIGVPDLLDWEFWFEVCKQMMQSNNSLTEVRAFAFIFATWDAINAVERRKEQLCLEMLLQERLFYRYFSHWSPMVRAYFHRLLCWRVARHDGNSSGLDTRICSTLADRLSKLWNYFVSFQASAGKQVAPPLSTAPCPPAPGRRLIIIRNDYDYSSPNMLLGLNDIIPSSFPDHPTSQAQQETDASDEDNPNPPPPQIKKGWRMLKTMFSNSNYPKSGEPPTPSGGLEQTKEDSEQESAQGAPSSDSIPPLQDETKPRSEIPKNVTKPHRRSSFRFTLEWSDRQRRVVRDRHLYPPSMPLATQRLVPSVRAQANSQSDSTSMSNSFSGTGSMNGSEVDSEEDTLPSNATDDSGPSKSGAVGAAPASTTAPSAEISHPAASKYAGRALAEWALVVSECDHFFQRRRGEGVPSDNMVEVPSLSVEPFRKP